MRIAVGRRKTISAAKVLKEPTEIFVAAFVRTRSPQGARNPRKDFTAEVTEVGEVTEAEGKNHG